MSALLEATGLNKTFGNGVRAVADVSLTVNRGETLGVVGESGCGKSTTGKILLGLLAPDSGDVTFDGESIPAMNRTQLRALRARLQVVPQNPQTSLNPRLTVRSSIEFNLRAHGVARAERGPRVLALLDRVGLTAAQSERFPHELSGGQLQRVAIARALSTSPDLVVCDEAVSALDKSVQAQVLNLLADLQHETGVAFLFISHDLAVVEHISDRVAVMYLGRVVEVASAERLWDAPQHPYTTALLSATPGQGRERIVLHGELPSPADPPSGCGFRTRCPVAEDVCAGEWPALIPVAPAHAAACVHVKTPATTG
ncbi:MAG: ABC transporter ATP-binding protein [Pseudonocardia sp.]|uniref:ABC transporter ATP-binding protein n=1 Tax=unclassified Pseudonocardia TaxID=2619320 RepID=UPI000869660C|nr:MULTISPECIES: ABC transporter ATP-binding protein [unclassified Pseudonocardia]MBN9110953.1 ABC transporter ATP-binding protein [Pseudonocardia sp.]ODU25038.1 MAG: peptide ABC transporter ATP-binding protein [Pseudonocardia sp. SCN 72-51]ODV05006.1 MAG: peptide ABC transporter ATP-binding protein [Pseudonocardia sp. SCN 73-27]